LMAQRGFLGDLAGLGGAAARPELGTCAWLQAVHAASRDKMHVM